jgi:hypothetical protein
VHVDLGSEDDIGIMVQEIIEFGKKGRGEGRGRSFPPNTDGKGMR